MWHYLFNRNQRAEPVGTVSSGIKRISSNQVLLIQMHLINSPSASVSTSMKADVLAVCFFGVVECSRRKDISNVMNEAKCPTAVPASAP